MIDKDISDCLFLDFILTERPKFVNNPKIIGYIKRNLIEIDKNENCLKITNKGVSFLSLKLLESRYKMDGGFDSFFVKENRQRIHYIKITSKNKFQIIFIPHFSVEIPFYEDYGYVLYKFSIKLNENNDIGLLNVYEHDLHFNFHFNPLSWLVISEKGNFFGISSMNIKKLLKNRKIKRAKLILVSEGFTYFCILSCIFKNNIISNIKIDFYLSKKNSTYFDSIRNLKKRIRYFSKFLDIIDFEKESNNGKEISVQSKISPLFPRLNKIYRISFVPKVIARHLRREEKRSYPLSILMKPLKTKFSNELEDISPWFATCSGGFLNEELDNKKLFSFRIFDIINLGDLIISKIVLAPYHKSSLNNSLKNIKI